jgi:nicotinamidase-related amidase
MKPVLLLVDLQNDFLRAGDLEPHPASIAAAATDLLKACRMGAVPVVHIWSTVNKAG